MFRAKYFTDKKSKNVQKADNFRRLIALNAFYFVSFLSISVRLRDSSTPIMRNTPRGADSATQFEHVAAFNLIAVAKTKEK